MFVVGKEILREGLSGTAGGVGRSLFAPELVEDALNYDVVGQCLFDDCAVWIVGVDSDAAAFGQGFEAVMGIVGAD